MFIVSDPSIATTHIGETPRAEIHQPEVTDSRTDPPDEGDDCAVEHRDCAEDGTDGARPEELG